MAYVPVPKDLTKVKTKVMFNLTRRQLVCFTADPHPVGMCGEMKWTALFHSHKGGG